MAYAPLHHKYRPQIFADLVGQEAIATTLTNAIRQERIAPAYLYAGPRGTGKTSSARILAKSLNCLESPKPTPEPCGSCAACRAIARSEALDVIEIDAASNTGVDNIRELIERAQFAPVQCRYKVYIIDECHMLSTAAFNALLKTLEEPPPRVVFVLATTDPQRVLPTIISRCQRFDFRRIPLEAMVSHLQKIADQEAIQIARDALQLVAQIAQGGLRDAESLLDQLSLLSGEITVDRVWDLVGAVPERDLLTLLEAIATHNPEAILDQARHLMDRGREPLIVLQNLASFYRDLLIAKTAPNRGDLVALTASTWEQLCQFVHRLDLATILAGQQHLRTCEIQVKNTTQPRLWLEIALLGLLPAARTSPSLPLHPQETPVPEVVTVTHPQGAASLSSVPVQPPTPVPEPLAAPSRLAPPAQPPAADPPPPPPSLRSPQVQPENSREALPPPPRQTTPPPATVDSLASAPPNPAASPPDRHSDLLPLPGQQAELNQIWQQLLNQLHPLSKALLAEHGCLLSLSGREAQIGIKQNLAKIAHNQLPGIEETFAIVLKRKIKVGLQIVEAIDAKAAPVPALATLAPPPNPGAGTTMMTSAPPQRQPPASSPLPPPAPAQPEATLAPRITPLQTEVTGSVSPPLEPSLRQNQDEIQAAARSLAQFFNGQVIGLETEGNTETSLTPELRPGLTPEEAPDELGERDDEDNGDELPF